ncbi:MAG: hypothetical protein IJ107_00295 [Lachnospiraceae bacterium]|nr:hypothetical protein [Lachnospiraceae bacterium]
MESTASQGVVVEGQNSVTLNNVNLTASNVTKNSDKSEWYQAVMIYQSMSGDADEGLASFAMNGGTLTNLNGDIFFVNNTTATIELTGATIINEDSEGVFLRAAAAPALAATAASRLQSPASDGPPDECAGEAPAALKRRKKINSQPLERKTGFSNQLMPVFFLSSITCAGVV